MSADNGIYIAKFPDGYRVTGVVGCIDNIDFFTEGSAKRKKELKKYFGKSKIFKTEMQAAKEGFKVQEDCGIGCYIEYGVCYIGEYESFL